MDDLARVVYVGDDNPELQGHGMGHPFAYHVRSDTIYIGPPGEYHAYMEDEAGMPVNWADCYMGRVDPEAITFYDAGFPIWDDSKRKSVEDHIKKTLRDEESIDYDPVGEFDWEGEGWEFSNQFGKPEFKWRESAQGDAFELSLEEPFGPFDPTKSFKGFIKDNTIYVWNLDVGSGPHHAEAYGMLFGSPTNPASIAQDNVAQFWYFPQVDERGGFPHQLPGNLWERLLGKQESWAFEGKVSGIEFVEQDYANRELNPGFDWEDSRIPVIYHDGTVYVGRPGGHHIEIPAFERVQYSGEYDERTGPAFFGNFIPSGTADYTGRFEWTSAGQWSEGEPSPEVTNAVREYFGLPVMEEGDWQLPEDESNPVTDYYYKVWPGGRESAMRQDRKDKYNHQPNKNGKQNFYTIRVANKKLHPPIIHMADADLPVRELSFTPERGGNIKDMEIRRPWLLVDEPREVVLGPHGAFHSELQEAMRREGYEVRDGWVPSITAGYVMEDDQTVDFTYDPSFGGGDGTEACRAVVDYLNAQGGSYRVEGGDDMWEDDWGGFQSMDEPIDQHGINDMTPGIQSKTATNRLEWTPGNYGKGWLRVEGTVWTWDVDEEARAPYHMHKDKTLKAMGLEGSRDNVAFEINPDGFCHRFGKPLAETLSDEQVAILQAADPNLKLNDEWSGSDPLYPWNIEPVT